MEREELNSIDESIRVCEGHIEKYRKQARWMLMAILTLVFSFISLLGFQFTLDSNNARDVYYSTAEIKDTSDDLKDLVNEEMKFMEYWVGKLSDSIPKADSLGVRLSDRDRFIRAIERVRSDTSEVNVISNKLNRIANQIPTTVTTIPQSSIYVIYGIFILLFGLATSFYRFYLKEISKNEHYLLGFHRIRIAGNNSNTGYEDYAKYYLTKDAFAIYDSGKGNKPTGQVENPLPGHPTSDISTEVLNRIFDKLDIKKKE